MCSFYLPQLFPSLRQMEDMNHINFPSLAGNWFMFYFEQWKYCFQRFMITSDSQNFTCLAGRLGKIILYSGIEMYVKVLEKTA